MDERVVVRLKSSGPCWGVDRAVDSAVGLYAKIQNNGGGEVGIFGELVHNPNSTKGLYEIGIQTFGKISEVAGKHVIVTAHGIDPKILAELEDVAASVTNETCPIVKLLHEKARELKSQGRKMVLIGRLKPHPEVRGVKGVLNGDVCVIEDEPQVRDLPFDPTDPIGVVAQTTFSPLKVASIVEVLKLRYKDVIYLPTTCSDVTSKILDVMENAKFFNLVIVVSGQNSENGRNIMEAAKLSGNRVLFILDHRDIHWESVKGIGKILVTSAASTLEPDIDAVMEKLKGWGWKEMVPKGPALSKEDRARNAARQAAGKPPLF